MTDMGIKRARGKCTARVVSPEISPENFRKFIPIFPEISGKLPERFYMEFFTTINLPNNCTFAYNDAIERLFTAPVGYNSLM